MKKIIKILASAATVAVIGASIGAFAGCSNGANGAAEAEINITGSTSVQPLMEALADAYESTHDWVSINVGGGGSGVGVTDAQSGKTDFGMASRKLKDDETGVEAQKIAMDGIALIVNKSCKVTNVTKAEVKALYEQGTAIQSAILGAISREEGSGTRDAFHEIIGIKSLHKGQGFEGDSSTSAVVTKVKGNTAGNQIGYISMGSMTTDVKALSFEGVAATVENVSNGSYTLARPFNIVFKSWDGMSEAAKDFINWIMGRDGQKIVTQEGYIAV